MPACVTGMSISTDAGRHGGREPVEGAHGAWRRRCSSGADCQVSAVSSVSGGARRCFTGTCADREAFREIGLAQLWRAALPALTATIEGSSQRHARCHRVRLRCSVPCSVPRSVRKQTGPRLLAVLLENLVDYSMPIRLTQTDTICSIWTWKGRARRSTSKVSLTHHGTSIGGTIWPFQSRSASCSSFFRMALLAQPIWNVLVGLTASSARTVASQGSRFA
jgi:hypothetical protein